MTEDRSRDVPLVLVVDNDEAFRQTTRLALLPMGVEVVEASNLEEARACLPQKPALIVLDYYLEPEVGTDLLDDVEPGTPVLLLTASLETTGLIQKHDKITAVARKPVDARKLRATAKTLLGIA